MLITKKVNNIPYIYKISNNINNKIYIGKTSSSIEKRWKEHCSDYIKRKMEKRPLYSAMNKYGVENFYIELIEEVQTNEEACIREQYWINFYDSYKNSYNATLGGDGKAYVDYNPFLKLWKEGKTCIEIAKITNHDAETVSRGLKQLGITSKDLKERVVDCRSKPVVMIDKNTNEKIKKFSSTQEAERFLQKEKASRHIAEVAKGKRKTAYGYKWKYLILDELNAE